MHRRAYTKRQSHFFYDYSVYIKSKQWLRGPQYSTFVSTEARSSSTFLASTVERGKLGYWILGYWISSIPIPNPSIPQYLNIPIP